MHSRLHLSLTVSLFGNGCFPTPSTTLSSSTSTPTCCFESTSLHPPEPVPLPTGRTSKKYCGLASYVLTDLWISLAFAGFSRHAVPFSIRKQLCSPLERSLVENGRHLTATFMLVTDSSLCCCCCPVTSSRPPSFIPPPVSLRLLRRGADIVVERAGTPYALQWAAPEILLPAQATNHSHENITVVRTRDHALIVEHA